MHTHSHIHTHTHTQMQPYRDVIREYQIADRMDALTLSLWQLVIRAERKCARLTLDGCESELDRETR
jgi:hypothetical protein